VITSSCPAITNQDGFDFQAGYEAIRFEDQARVLLDAEVPAFSSIYGIPPRELLDECRRKQIVILGTATTVDEAKALEDAGVDIVVASGFETGTPAESPRPQPGFQKSSFSE
jgi:NAD(P)H-dependent flavin oxidoreductase YrpB (nitropropane dioxygenase family)